MDPEKTGKRPCSRYSNPAILLNMKSCRRFNRTIPALLTVLLMALLPGLSRADVWLIDVRGAIGPATADHMDRGLEKAQAAGAELVVLRIDTPGGLDLAMRDMIKAILAAQVPVVGYVAPSGARAASAGTYLLYATHIAAMAPGTNLGAATPVQISGMPQLPGSEPGDNRDETASADSALAHKIVNDAVAYIQSLAQLRGRNAQWAERAVREGASLSAEDALAQGVIELLASSPAQLLAQLDGRKVEVAGIKRTLDARWTGGTPASCGLAQSVPRGDHQSKRCLRIDADRYLRPDNRVLQPRFWFAGCRRRHLFAACAIRFPDAACQLLRVWPSSFWAWA